MANRSAFYGLCGPKGLPRSVVDKLHGAIKAVLADPETRRLIEETGSTVVGNSPAEFAEQIKAELVTYKKVVYLQRLKID